MKYLLSKKIILTGSDLTIEKVVKIAKDRVKVTIHNEAEKRVSKAYNLLIVAACQGSEIYGLTNSVGAKRDVKVLRGNICENGCDKLNDETIARSKEFNERILYAHNTNVGSELSEDIIRALMLARVNTMLKGITACNPNVVNMFVEFLNSGIHPVIYSKGSTGLSDINILPTIGLAMMGKSDVEVFYKENRMNAKTALEEAKLTPIEPYAKDGLSILSSNSYSAGMGSIVLYRIEKLLNMADIVFALSLEGLNGNIAPLIKEVQDIRPYKGQNISANKISNYLAGSYLWNKIDSLDNDKNRYKMRSLQDPLSFRDASQVHGAVRDIIESLKEKIEIQLNSSDDNPAVLVDVLPDINSTSTQVKDYIVIEDTKDNNSLRGMIVPTANNEPIYWVLYFETLGIALCHLSKISCGRIINLGSSELTSLNRFLAPDENSYGFGILQNTCLSLNTEIRSLCNPSSVDFLDVVGSFEDDATNAPFVVHQIDKIIDNLYYILGIELFHAAQAVDLRKNCAKEQNDENFIKLGSFTNTLYEAYRQEVPYVNKDRSYNIDIITSYKFLQSYIIE